MAVTFEKSCCFCGSNSIQVPEMTQTYKDIIRSRSKKDNVTVGHHYRVDVFIAAIDSQLQELNSRFNKSVAELLQLSVALDPKKPFNKSDICKLAKTFYPSDFTEGLRETKKSELYPFLDRLIHLILTLPVSTATSERAFSSMKIVKTGLHCSMGDDFLRNCLILYIESDIVESLSIDEIIDDFANKKRRRVQLQFPKKKIERYMEGLPEEIQGNVIVAGKETLDGVIPMAKRRKAAANKQAVVKTSEG
ncbi:uncharacterized protein [Rutidosis leptorrhynchoides]|uniref:uncharacterized protein n=1 Tax=Rutidosis leptorrhynchoides TaxID=125765 RepID=UPI003A99173B